MCRQFCSKLLLPTKKKERRKKKERKKKPGLTDICRRISINLGAGQYGAQY